MSTKTTPTNHHTNHYFILNPTMTTEPDKAAAQSTQLIDQETLGTIADYSVWSEMGEEVKFGSLYSEKKTVVVFIRLSPLLVVEGIELTQTIRSLFLRRSRSLFRK